MIESGTREINALHFRFPATRGISGTRGVRCTSWRQRGCRRFEARILTGRPCAACSPSCNTRHRRHARASKEPAPVGLGAGSRAVDSRGDHVLHLRHPATRGITRTLGVSRWSRRQHVRRRFEGRRLTGRSCAACSLDCNTRQRTHARCQPMEPAPVGEGAGLRAVDSPGVHVLHVCEPATRGNARTRVIARTRLASFLGRRGFKGRKLTGRSCAACSRPCNTGHRTYARCQSMEPAPARQGAGSSAVDSPGDHVLHVREPATRGHRTHAAVSQ